MVDEGPNLQAHWQNVYQTRSADAVSWFRPRLGTSLDLLRSAGLASQSRLIDVGGGASTLVDDLLDVGLEQVTVLDISSAALDVARTRLSDRADHVEWIVGDVLSAGLPEAGFDFWHDRAVLHFLTKPSDAEIYAKQAARAVRPGGFAVIGGFSPNGPERCSGLPVARRSARDVGRVLSSAFRLLTERSERHVTPAGAAQEFAYALLQRQ
jgi:ubiquinone/menaquinone biosynthesis C-methylase UbiE